MLISLAGDSQDDYLSNYDELEPSSRRRRRPGLDTDLAGPFAVFNDVNEITSEDLARAEVISLPVVLLLALLIFGSLVAASMPALVGLLAMVGALALVRVITKFTEVSVFSVNVISLLGIGLAIDYALFMVSRFREELALLPVDDPDASATAITPHHGDRRSHRAVLRADRRRGDGEPADLPAGVPQEHGLRRHGGRAGRDAGRAHRAARDAAAARPPGRRRPAAVAPAPPGRGRGRHGCWARLARGVMRRPWLVIAVTVTCLLVLASPFLGVKWGSVDYRVLPPDAPAHVAADKLDRVRPRDLDR